MNNIKKEINIIISNFFIASFAGWLLEIITMSIYYNHFVPRGFLNLPLCPIYGFGITISYIIVKRLQILYIKPVKRRFFFIFLIVFITAFIIEFFTGLVLDKMFHIHLWSYNNMIDNFLGYVSLSVLLVFALLGSIYITTIYKRLNRFLMRFSYKSLILLNTLLISSILIDLILIYIS